MKTRYLILISMIVGLAAMTIDAFPMWWGVLFAPITEKLSSTPVTEELTQGFFWQADGFIIRLRGLDFLTELFGKFH